MSTYEWFTGVLILSVLAQSYAVYLRGWRNGHRRWPSLFTRFRLCSFSLAVILIILVAVSPGNLLSRDYLAIRSVQKIVFCMIVPPLVWLSCPFHVFMLGLETDRRRWFVHHLLRRSHLRQTVRSVTQPGISWLVYMILFMLWHEPSFASWSMHHGSVGQLFLWILLGSALLFWWHILRTGPRLHVQMPLWVTFVYLVGIEIFNMLVGVTIAFARTPIYSYYAHRQSPVEFSLNLTTMQDQMLSGGFTWITGSIVYISTIILVLNRFFQQEKALPPVLSFSQPASERTIAPGLEYRVVQNRWEEANPSSDD